MLFDAARQMLEAAAVGLDSVRGGDGGPTGELRLTVPGFLEGTSFFEDIADFLAEHPRVRLTVVSTDERRNLVAGAFDLALRMGQLEDSDLRVRRVASLRRVLVASPGYVARRERPATPAELATLDFFQLGSRPSELTLVEAGGPVERVRFRPRGVVSSGLAIVGLVRAGAGVAALPEVLVRSDLASGALVHVLPRWSPEELGIYLVWPDGAVRRHLTARLATFLAPRLDRLFGGGVVDP